MLLGFDDMDAWVPVLGLVLGFASIASGMKGNHHVSM